MREKGISRGILPLDYLLQKYGEDQALPRKKKGESHKGGDRGDNRIDQRNFSKTRENKEEKLKIRSGGGERLDRPLAGKKQE